MSQQYANTQPSDFVNYIRNVAIVGASGNQGSYIVNELLATGKHTVTAITREDSSSTFPQGVHVSKINYASQDSIVAALKGQDALIITMSTTAPQEQVKQLIEAAAKAGVKWVIPNEWGIDSNNESLGADTFLGPPRIADRALIEKLGMSWIGVVGGFWYQFSLALPLAYGFDIPNRSVTFYDDGASRFTTSTWDQYAHTVARLMSLKVYPDDEKDTSPTLSGNFSNKFAHLKSFRLSQKDIFESLKRVTGTSDADWKVTHEPSDKRYAKGMEDFKASPGPNPYMTLLYARTLYPNGDGDLESKFTLANDILGLPKEDLDACTEDAVKRSQKS